MHRSRIIALLPHAFAGALALAAGLPAQDRPTLRERPVGLQVVEPDQRDLDLRMTPVVRAVQKAADSVVSIYVNLELAARRSVTEGQGSGVILDEKGFVISNWHVVAAVQPDSGYSLLVKLKDGRALPARVLSSSPIHDLALLQLQLPEGERVQPAQIGRSANLMIGETLIAIGNPQGHANTVTSGVLSASGRSIRVRGPDGQFREYTGLLQTDAAINQGNSGGALLDITGKLIGINNAMAVGAENIGFAIPVDTVREVFETQLLASEGFTAASDTAWLGMEVVDADDGVVVKSIVADGPAAQAGVSVGDRLIGAGDNRVARLLDYAHSVYRATPGRPFPLRIVRKGRELQLTPHPVSRTIGAILRHTGIEIDEVPAEEDRALAERVTRVFYEHSPYRRLPLFPAVLRVRRIQSGSPAAEIGLREGDALLATVLQDRFGRDIDYPVDSATGFEQLLRQLQGRSLKLAVLRDDADMIGTLEVRRVDQR